MAKLESNGISPAPLDLFASGKNSGVSVAHDMQDPARAVVRLTKENRDLRAMVDRLAIENRELRETVLALKADDDNEKRAKALVDSAIKLLDIAERRSKRDAEYHLRDSLEEDAMRYRVLREYITSADVNIILSRSICHDNSGEGADNELDAYISKNCENK